MRTKKFSLAPAGRVRRGARDNERHDGISGPFLESAVSHAELVRQVTEPPFAGHQALRGPPPRAEAQPVHQAPGPLRREAVRVAAGRAEALPIEDLRDDQVIASLVLPGFATTVAELRVDVEDEDETDADVEADSGANGA
jgi:hypothetical protein